MILYVPFLVTSNLKNNSPGNVLGSTMSQLGSIYHVIANESENDGIPSTLQKIVFLIVAIVATFVYAIV